jgi:hypothetical protein
MKTTDIHSSQEAFARMIAGQLDDHVSHDVSERLRYARMKAVAARRSQAVVNIQSNGSAVLQPGSGNSLWLQWLASTLPIIALIVGLFFIHWLQTERNASQLAAVDTALLTDELPPAAYTDPGFLKFLKTPGATESASEPE